MKAAVWAACEANGLAQEERDKTDDTIKRSIADGMEKPHSDVESDERPTVKVRDGFLHDQATEGEAALIKNEAPFYVREKFLLRPVTVEVDAAHGRKATVVRLSEVTKHTLLDHLSRAARWVKHDGRSKESRPINPPDDVAMTILARDGEWNFPHLAGVITTPTMRPDGSILSEPGYDEATRLLLLNPPKLPDLLEHPTRADAQAALALLEGLIVEFPFVDGPSRAVALSGIITPVVRGAVTVAPLHAFRAPVAGSGKSLLVDLASGIATGQYCPVISAGKTEEETEKRLGGMVLAGDPLISIDNLNGRLQGDALCQLVERPRVKIRILGRSILPVVESRATFFATGNNIQPTGDMLRRMVLCSLDPDMERPEQRKFKGDPFKTVLADRGKYITACLTIVRAWIRVGIADPVTPLGSFGEWSHLVRSALVWLGQEDPVATMDKAREDDPSLVLLHEVISTLAEEIGIMKPFLSKDLVEKVSYCERFQGIPNPKLLQALQGTTPYRLDSRSIGNYLARNEGRIIDGLKLVGVMDKKRKVKRYFVAEVSRPKDQELPL